ncbi:hypothetical protein ACHWQZ_G006734 [Mnemiopsis leidyi]
MVAPSTGPGTLPGPLFPDGCDCGVGGLGTGAETGGYFNLSVRTCIEVLPLMPEAMVLREFELLEKLDPESLNKLNSNSLELSTVKSTRSKLPLTVVERKRALLKESLSRTLERKPASTIRNNNNLASYILRSLEETEKRLEESVEKLQELSNSYQTRTVVLDEIQDQPAAAVSNPDPEVPLLNDPVRIADFNFADVSFDAVRESFTFDQRLPGNRLCKYFSELGYSYGLIYHQPAPYPDNQLLDNIFATISTHDPSFTKKNFSCLVTYYQDSNATIYMHSDEESSMVPESNIYTVSFGEKRTLRLHNTSSTFRATGITKNPISFKSYRRTIPRCPRRL